jgi:hypothetical protein
MPPSQRPAKRLRDPNQLAKLIADIVTGEVSDETPAPESEMAERGRSGGVKGGKARADALTPERRSDGPQARSNSTPVGGAAMRARRSSSSALG